ncbi:MAG: substrate-binding domain-containing protein [bacterium]
MARNVGNFVFCFLLSISIMSCGGKDTGSERLTISVIPKGTTHVFWQAIHAGAVKAARELEVDVLWVGPEREDNRQQQIALVDNQVLRQVDGIVLAPTDQMALRRPVRAAVQKNIPVVIIDSGLADSEDIYTSFIATDNREGGRMAGRELAKLLDGKGRVILLRLQEGSASTTNREEGFLETIAQFPGIEVASSEQYGGATVASGQQVAENLILRFLDEQGNLPIDGIFCCNETTTYGMLQALRRFRLAGKVKFIGFDSAPPLIEAMRQNELHGLIIQDPFKMGYLGVKTMVQHLQGQSVPKRIDSGVTFVSHTDVDKPALQHLIHPDIDRWLKNK